MSVERLPSPAGQHNAAVPTQGGGARDFRRRERIAFLVLAVPTVAFLFAITIFPLIFSLQKAFNYYVLYKPQAEHFIGFDNFRLLLTSEYTLRSLMNTIVYVAVTVAAEMVLGFAFALLLSRRILGQGFLRTMLMVPVLLSPIVVGLSWRFMYNPNIGIINQLLEMIGISGIHWLENPNIAFLSVMIPEIWQWTPFVALVFLAGLHGISPEIQEAALLDGLRLRHLVRYIYVPMLMPVAAIILLLRMIDSMKAFDIVYILTQGGPGLSTMLVSIRTWTLALVELNMGQAAALSFLVLILVSVLAAVFLSLLKERSF